MRVAIYTRVASFDAARESHERQELDCRTFADERGWTVVDVYSDGGMSRGERDRMVQAGLDEEFDVILTWDLTRLSRRPLDLEQVLDTGCRIVCANGTFDTKRPADAFIARMSLAWPEDADLVQKRRERTSAVAGEADVYLF